MHAAAMEQEREMKKARLEHLRASGQDHQASLEMMMDKMMEMQMRQAEMFQNSMNAQQSMFQQMMTEFVTKDRADAETVPPHPLAFPSLAAGTATPVIARNNTLSELADKGSFDAKEWETAAAAQQKKSPPATIGQSKAIKSVGSDFRTKLHQLLNAEDKLQQLKDRQALLNDGKPAAGIKPYSQPWDFPSMDEPSSHQGKSITIVVPNDYTHAETRELLYYRYHSLLAAIDLEIWNHRKDSVKCSSSFESFVTAVKTQLHAESVGLEKYTSLVEAPPGLTSFCDEAGYEAALKQYSSMVKEMATERATRDRAKKRDQEKLAKEAKRIEDMTPDEVLEAKFKDIANKIHGNKKQGPKPKNGGTPGAAPGQNQAKTMTGNNKKESPPPKGKGKGKGKENKGKGKGKTKGNSTDKGKGKGKGQGSSGSGDAFWRRKPQGGSKGSHPKKKVWQ